MCPATFGALCVAGAEIEHVLFHALHAAGVRPQCTAYGSGGRQNGGVARAKSAAAFYSTLIDDDTIVRLLEGIINHMCA